MSLLERLKQRLEAPTLGVALRYLGEYAALRSWAVLMDCFPVRTNLVTGRLMGDLWWLLRPAHRERAMNHLRAAFGDEYSDAELRRIARRSLEHFAQLYLVELVMTPRLVNEWSWARYVELDDLGPALRELLSGRPVLMLTPHFGNFELMGYTVSRLGLPMTAVMRPLDNPLITAHLIRTRQAGGLSLLFKKGATAKAPEVLARGEPLSFIADQDAGRKGLFVEFFGRPASTYKSIGLLAMQYGATVIVGSATRIGREFRYRLRVDRIIQPEEWREREDPLFWITQEFSYAMEAAIRRAPEQYLWVHRRWKHQPKAPKAQLQPSSQISAPRP